MSHVAFDTLKFAERLKAAGLPEKQANALSEAQNEALIEALDTTLATKSDMQQLQQQLLHLDGDVRLLRWMSGFMLGGMVSMIGGMIGLFVK